MTLSFTLKHSFPKLTENDLLHLEAALSEKFDYPALPQDYKQFLLANNGGYVSHGDIDIIESGYRFEDEEEWERMKKVYFETPLFWVRDNNRPVQPAIVMFCGFWRETTMKVEQLNKWQKELGEIIAANEYSKHDFNVLPDKLISIGQCGDIQAGDLLCISLAEEDYGSIYYYYNMWYYPAKFHGTYYADKEQAILKKYGLTDPTQIDKRTALGKQIEEELRRVPFVKVADSFTDFLENLTTVNHGQSKI
ncbi:MAG: SMI1/KNR4 family protein [Cytophagales bacterium]|nr:MAG: SMI1/KNR4 family protein [Cytophagales bacterium]